jgi:intracellular multiplication protein IcmV
MDQNIKNEPPKKGIAGRFFKSFVDVKAWVSYDEVKTNTKTIYSLFARFFSKRPNKTIYQETFAEAVLRLNLTEKQINDRRKIFLYSALIYSCLSLALIAYAVYLMKKMLVVPAIFTLILTIFIVALTYREHLWYMQMSKRKLGCNFKEWLNFILRKNP